MRINAADTSLSRFIIRPENPAVQNHTNPLASSNYGDKLALSSLGERLRFQGEAIARWDEKLTDAADDKHLQLMDKSISAVGSLLEQMKSLTILAEDESLTDSDRMRLQIQMTNLQKRLTAETKRMSLRLAGKPEEEIMSLLGEKDFVGANASDSPAPEGSMLQRALARVENGEVWDIAEKWELSLTLKEVVVITDDGRQTFQAENGEFELPPDIDSKEAIISKIHEVTGGRHVPTDDPKTPTVSEILKQNRTIVLMDAESAKEGTERLDREIEELSKMRETFVEVRDEKRAEAKAKSGETGMDEGRLDAMLARIEQERLAREARIAEDIRVAEGGTPGVPDGDGKAKKVRVQTPLGVMEYEQFENRLTDNTDPRLVGPDGPLGVLFAKLEKLFKEGIGMRLGTPKPSMDPNRILSDIEAQNQFSLGTTST